MDGPALHPLATTAATKRNEHYAIKEEQWISTRVLASLRVGGCEVTPTIGTHVCNHHQCGIFGQKAFSFRNNLPPELKDCTSKAFDKVPHPRLLSKLQHCDIDVQLLMWYENFFAGRTQFVRFHGASSEPSEVVQGNVLGPFLLNIFVADLPEMVKNSTLIQYADDATTSQEDTDDLQEDLCNIDI
ncbi:Hypothetical predicted protein [Cloeon dipterum]|uniref:Reverse transcriptase domain-containing protein n=1 Tax=Cloeon dipterum TaxID=197152 RepID=A0A8S1DWX0_9INSE|nr:Hypothetical predicted protein [Cloeon dipterum]